MTLILLKAFLALLSAIAVYKAYEGSTGLSIFQPRSENTPPTPKGPLRESGSPTLPPNEDYVSGVQVPSQPLPPVFRSGNYCAVDRGRPNVFWPTSPTDSPSQHALPFEVSVYDGSLIPATIESTSETPEIMADAALEELDCIFFSPPTWNEQLLAQLGYSIAWFWYVVGWCRYKWYSLSQQDLVNVVSGLTPLILFHMLWIFRQRKEPGLACNLEEHEDLLQQMKDLAALNERTQAHLLDAEQQKYAVEQRQEQLASDFEEYEQECVKEIEDLKQRLDLCGSDKSDLAGDLQKLQKENTAIADEHTKKLEHLEAKLIAEHQSYVELKELHSTIYSDVQEDVEKWMDTYRADAKKYVDVLVGQNDQRLDELTTKLCGHYEGEIRELRKQEQARAIASETKHDAEVRQLQKQLSEIQRLSTEKQRKIADLEAILKNCNSQLNQAKITSEGRQSHIDDLEERLERNHDQAAHEMEDYKKQVQALEKKNQVLNTNLNDTIETQNNEMATLVSRNEQLSLELNALKGNSSRTIEDLQKALKASQNLVILKNKELDERNIQQEGRFNLADDSDDSEDEEPTHKATAKADANNSQEWRDMKVRVQQAESAVNGLKNERDSYKFQVEMFKEENETLKQNNMRTQDLLNEAEDEAAKWQSDWRAAYDTVRDAEDVLKVYLTDHDVLIEIRQLMDAQKSKTGTPDPASPDSHSGPGTGSQSEPDGSQPDSYSDAPDGSDIPPLANQKAVVEVTNMTSKATDDSKHDDQNATAPDQQVTAAEKEEILTKIGKGEARITDLELKLRKHDNEIVRRDLAGKIKAAESDVEMLKQRIGLQVDDGQGNGEADGPGNSNVSSSYSHQSEAPEPSAIKSFTDEVKAKEETIKVSTPDVFPGKTSKEAEITVQTMNEVSNPDMPPVEAGDSSTEDRANNDTLKETNTGPRINELVSDEATSEASAPRDLPTEGNEESKSNSLNDKKPTVKSDTRPPLSVTTTPKTGDPPRPSSRIESAKRMIGNSLAYFIGSRPATSTEVEPESPTPKQKKERRNGKPLPLCDHCRGIGLKCDRELKCGECTKLNQECTRYDLEKQPGWRVTKQKSNRVTSASDSPKGQPEGYKPDQEADRLGSTDTVTGSTKDGKTDASLVGQETAEELITKTRAAENAVTPEVLSPSNIPRLVASVSNNQTPVDQLQASPDAKDRQASVAAQQSPATSLAIPAGDLAQPDGGAAKSEKAEVVNGASSPQTPRIKKIGGEDFDVDAGIARVQAIKQAESEKARIAFEKMQQDRAEKTQEQEPVDSGNEGSENAGSPRRGGRGGREGNGRGERGV